MENSFFYSIALWQLLTFKDEIDTTSYITASQQESSDSKAFNSNVSLKCKNK